MSNPARTLAKLTGTFHNISYYAPEMKAFADLGLAEYWRAYFAYRSAPMGVVPAGVVTSTFYNFAPQRVREGIPSAWDTTTPTEVLSLRDRCITEALGRALRGHDPALVNEAADLALDPVLSAEVGARPLFAAHQALPIPDEPLLRLWFACTLWREHRGDGHNIALAAADIDGIECHILLAARGVGDQATIGKIRGWSPADWQAATDRLATRGMLTPAGELTPPGQQLRADIETHTDLLATRPRLDLGESGTERLIELLDPLVGELISSGSVPGRWPPPRPPA